ncbi:MAG: NlpC/P60 family protein [Anaerolineales bacterium]
MAQRIFESYATPFRKSPAPRITAGGWIRRFSIFLLSWLLVGCQSNGNFLASPGASTEQLLPSSTSLPATLETDTVTPSQSPELTPALPTPDAREYVVATLKADVWDAPANENSYWNLQTQLILGEKVLVVGRQGEWSKIAAVEQPSKKDPLGYPGWVRSEFLAAGWSGAQQYAVVMAPHAPLRDEPGGSRLMSLYLDTRLSVESTQKDWVQVRLPDGKTGWLSSGDVRLTDNLSAPVPADGLLALAQALIGVKYQWGGTTTDSLDCSGFTYRVFHAYGILLSRDADDQALGGEFVARKDIRKGDLIFVSEQSGGLVSHMSIYWGNSTVLDAVTIRGVVIRTFPDFFTNYYWITARRYLP